MKHYLISLVLLFSVMISLVSCGEVSFQSDEDALTRLWISADRNDFDIDLSGLKFNQEFNIQFKSNIGQNLCLCRSVFLGTGDSGNYTLNCPGTCALQFTTLNTANGSYTLSISGILELCRNPSNLLLCREYK